MAVVEWLAAIASRWWDRRHRVVLETAIARLPDRRLVPVVCVRNAGHVAVWIDSVGGAQGGRVFVIPDPRLPVQLEPDGPWVDFPVTLDANFLPDEPWTAIVREPNGTEHRSR